MTKLLSALYVGLILIPLISAGAWQFNFSGKIRLINGH